MALHAFPFRAGLRALMLALPLACSVLPAMAAAPGKVQVWLSTADKRQLLAAQAPLAFAPAGKQQTVIHIEPARRYQEIVGFGASVTDSSAWLIQNKLGPAERTALLQELFGSEGLGISFTRLSIGGSDFSLAHYTLDDMPPGQSDPELKNFSIDMNHADVIPVTKAALAINPRLKVMGSPWSAPAWMKANDSLIKGAIKPEAFPAFAEYFNRYIAAYKAEGIPIFAVTLQNEPHYEPKDYLGMRFTPAARAAFIGKHLGPLLAERHPEVRILEWDHNWDEPESPLEALADPLARKYINGVAWHCYLGDPASQSVVRDAYPDKDVYMTECSPLRRAWFMTCEANGGKCPDSQSAVDWADTLAHFVRTEIIDTTRNWARGVQLWNLALDENHGPRAGGCPVCRGVVTINSVTGAVSRGVEYYTLAHAGRFVRQGAVRIASDSGKDGLETVAFRNADNGSLALIVVNAAKEARSFAVRIGRRSFNYSMAAGSVATFTWK